MPRSGWTANEPYDRPAVLRARLELKRAANPKAMSQRIRMYTTHACSDSRRAKWFLSERQLPFEEINIELTPEAEESVLRANASRRRLPTFDVGGRTFHCSPFDPEKLRRELGL